MSVASSAASQREVSFQGEEVSVEQALVIVTDALRSAVNLLQTSLTNLCALEEQEVDADDDFKEAVAIEDRVNDCLDLFASHSRDLKKIAAELRGKCPPGSTQWWAGHKAVRASEKKNKPAAAVAPMEF
jgi:hypothetical protein